MMMISLFQSKSGGISAIALYDYQAMAEDEISFDPNDIITNIEMVKLFCLFYYNFLLWDVLVLVLVLSQSSCCCLCCQVDEGWWIGECRGKFGLFPANYVETLNQEQ